MNNSPSPTIKVQVIPDPNPWEDREAAPRLPLPAVLVLALAVLCGAAYPALIGTLPFLWVPVFAVCALCLLRVVRGIIPLLMAALIFLAGLLVGSPALGTALLGVLTAVALTALLITLTRSNWLLLLPVIAYALAWGLSGSYELALLALLPFPAAAALAWGTMKNDRRVSVICATAIALLVCVLLAIAAYWYEVEHELTMESYVRAFEAIRVQAAAEFAKAPETPEINAMLQEMGYPFTIEDVYDTVITVLMVLMPALLTVLCSIFAYAAQLLCVRSYAGCGVPRMMTRTAQLFVLSVPAGLISAFCSIVLFIHVLLSMFFTVQAGLFIIVLINLQLILLPGTCVVGAWKLYADFRRRPSIFVAITVVISAVLMPMMLLISLSLSGAFTTVVRPLIAKMLAEGIVPDDHSDGEQR